MIGSARKSRTLYAPILGLMIVCQIALSQAGVPVVIWCPHNETSEHNLLLKTAYSNPLQKLSSEKFYDLISQSNIKELTIIVTYNLCVEDLKNHEMLSKVTNGFKKYYFPCVSNPNTILENIYKNKTKTVENINDDHSMHMVLKDTNANTCVALTGKRCPFSHVERKKREVAENNTTEFKIKTDTILFYSSKSLFIKSPEDSKKDLELPESKVIAMSSQEYENKTWILTIKFSNIEDINDLTLDFYFLVKSMGYYSLDKINYNAKGKTGDLWIKRDISFPYNFSYHCSLNTTFANNLISLNITDMQVQIGHKNAIFNDAYDCVGFTSIPIWTGIFVTAILALIMIWALTMIMDIRTMDRFDDPKGKTITISTAE